MRSLDLTDAYFDIFIYLHSQKCFGVAIASLEFTQIVKEVKFLTRPRNITLLGPQNWPV